MKRFLLQFSWLALVVPPSCGMVACVDNPPDEPEVSSTESELSYAWCVDHPCADLVVRVLKDNYYTKQVVQQDACTINGTGVLIGNHGTASAGASTLTIYTSSTGVTRSYSIPALGAGFSYLLNVTVPKGSTVTADVNDVVMEGNENWNEYNFYCI